VKRALSLGLKPFGSPTLSDQALMNFPSLKIGPGASSRSHIADEFVYLSEIREAVDLYVRLLSDLDIK
jgi:acetylornithine deacetylase